MKYKEENIDMFKIHTTVSVNLSELFEIEKKKRKKGKRASSKGKRFTSSSKDSEKYEIGSYEYNRNCYLFTMYGITLEDYNNLFTKQNGCCAICGRPQSEFKKALSTDHCHETGKVRGLLCKDCNFGLGHFKDNKDIIKKALGYLE